MGSWRPRAARTEVPTTKQKRQARHQEFLNWTSVLRGRNVLAMEKTRRYLADYESKARETFSVSKEKRSAPRLRAVLKGEIRYENGLMSTPCLIRDISEIGARLELPGDLVLPDRFDLYIEKKNQTRHSVLKRKRGVEVGVAFLDMPAPALGLPERVLKLEAEVARLRGLVERLQAGETA